MKQNIGLFLGSAAVLTAILAIYAFREGSRPSETSVSYDFPTNIDLEAALEKKVTIECEGQPLESVLEELQKQTGVPIGMKYEGEDGTEDEIAKFFRKTHCPRLSVEGISLRSTLNLLAAQINVPWRMGDREILFSSEEDSAPTETRIYDLPKCFREPSVRVGGERSEEEDPLRTLIPKHIRKHLRTDSGGDGMFCRHGNQWTVRTTKEGHRLLARFFAVMDGTLDESSRWSRFDEVLNTPISVDYKNASLDEIAEDLRARCSVPIVILGQEDILGEVRLEHFTFTAANLPLRRILDRLVLSTDIRWTLRDECLTFCTAYEARDPGCFETRFYPLPAERRQSDGSRLPREMKNRDAEDAIRNVFYPEQWCDTWECLSSFDGGLIVTQRPERHARLAALCAFLNGETSDFDISDGSRSLRAYALPEKTDPDALLSALNDLTENSAKISIYFNRPELPNFLLILTEDSKHAKVRDFLNPTNDHGEF